MPTGVQGSLEVQPPDAKVPNVFRKVRVRFGRPIDVTRYLDRADDRLVLRQITDEVMYEIRNLSGQEYVDAYATKTSETMPAETAKPAVGVVEVPDPEATAGTGNGNGSGTGNGDGASRSSTSVLRAAPMPS